MTRTFPAVVESIPEIIAFATVVLKHKKGDQPVYAGEKQRRTRISEKLLKEYALLLEEITLKLVEKSKPGAVISVEIYRRLGKAGMRLTCAGEPIALSAVGRDDFGGQILEEFADYLSQSYTGGVNVITFAVSTLDDILLLDAAALVLSMVAGTVLRCFCTPYQLTWIVDNVLDVMVLAFTGLLSTLSLPVAFFSLAAFLVKIRMVMVRDGRTRNLALRYMASSLLAIGVGVALWWAYRRRGMILGLKLYGTGRLNFMGESLREIVLNCIPESILEPFAMSNPIPMLLLAIMLGYVVSQMFGTEGRCAFRFVRTGDALFCRMLTLVYNLMPLFLFAALLRRWLEDGYGYLGKLLPALAYFLPAILVVLVLYLVQLWVAGIRPKDFVRQYGDVLWENLKIGSNVQALPYNKRMLSRRAKLPRSLLDDGLKLGSIMNMDGNCVMVTLGILLMISAVGLEMSLMQELGVLLILLLVSLGAPNQPGSFLVVMVLLCTYVGVSPELYPDLLIIEAVYGRLYSFLNSAGDICTMLTMKGTAK